MARVTYPQVAPAIEHAPPLCGTSAGQGVCHVPSKHWQFDTQPAMAPMQTCAGEQRPPSMQLRLWLLPPVPHAPKMMAAEASATPVRDMTNM